MTEELKKTQEAHGTISEEAAQEKAEDTKQVTSEMIEEEKAKEVKEEEKQKEEAVEEMKKKEESKKQNNRRGFRDENPLEGWEPKTKLGKDVKSEKIKDIDEILDNDRKILESEIVDTLIAPKADLIAMGQAKGKFGGGKRRAWRQTQRITREGGVMTFSAMAVTGDENGHVGLGTGRAGETLPARSKATRKAKINTIKVTRGCAAFDCDCSLKHTVPFVVKGKSGSVGIELIPAPQGTGLVCANEVKKILKLAGIQDVYSKTSGQVRTTFNLAKACIEALKETNRK